MTDKSAVTEFPSTSTTGKILFPKPAGKVHVMRECEMLPMTGQLFNPILTETTEALKPKCKPCIVILVPPSVGPLLGTTRLTTGKL